MVSDEPLELAIGVTELARFLHRTGDLHVRYETATAANEGVEAQRRAQRDRGDGYRREVKVVRTHVFDGGTLAVSGRIDGVDAAGRLEEYKATRTDPQALHRHLGSMHMAQLKLYGAMLEATPAAGDGVDLALVYVHPDDLSAHVVAERYTRACLESFFEDTCSRFAAWMLAYRRHARMRNTSLTDAPFPFPGYRGAQHRMARRAYAGAVRGGHGLIEASTGSGKTMAALFSSLKAVAGGHAERVLFMTARGTGQHAAETACAGIRSVGGRFRSITLTARAKVCLTPGAACTGEECTFAKGYHDRAEAAVRDLLDRDGSLERDVIEAAARRHRVCPFELSLDTAAWCDVVIGDYNYLFDPLVRLSRLRGLLPEPTFALIDEAHQLAPRVRDMLSVAVHRRTLAAALGRALPDRVARALRSLDRAFLALRRPHADAPAPLSVPEPAAFLRAARRVLEASTLEGVDDPLLGELTFALLRLTRMAEDADDESHCWLLDPARRDSRLTLLCVDAARHIARTLAECRGSLSFSGTLTPLGLYRRLHGQDELELDRMPTPFAPEQLGVLVVPDVPTRYRRRAAGLDALARTVHDVVSSRPGNYLVALPSYAYLRDLDGKLASAFPGLDIDSQRGDMSAEEERAFLAGFRRPGGRVALVVIGGRFTESVDFAGDSLIGMIVVGIGLPPPTPAREAMARRFGELGHLVAYQQPAMTRVVQAAGRIIRGPADRGILCLVDDRYLDRDHRRYFPDYWRPRTVKAGSVATAVADFWQAP